MGGGRAMSTELSKGRLSLRARLVRVHRIPVAGPDARHTLILLGRPAPTISRLFGRYMRARDLSYVRGELRARDALPATSSSQVVVRRATGSDLRPVGSELDQARALQYYEKPDAEPRVPLDELVERLLAYDVVSFDIFDTAIYRAVERPTDVFRIMASEMGVDRFPSLRKKAEHQMRELNNNIIGSREVTLSEIYSRLAERYSIDPRWAQRECDLEIELSRPNPFVKEVYDRLVAAGRRVVFTTDMYLPADTLATMLHRNGFAQYDDMLVSSVYRKRKGDGTLQGVLRERYGSEASIVHVGDLLDADYEKSIEAGLDAILNPSQHRFCRENDMDSLAGSFYGAVVNNMLGCGEWTKGRHYTHGFRVGGILTVGYAEYLDDLSVARSVDRILFCGRDCDVIHKVYARHYGSVPSVYVDISRNASLSITLGQNYEEYISRTFFRYYDESKNMLCLEQILAATGFEYLVPYLESSDIDKYLFPSSIKRVRLNDFFWDFRSVVEEQNRGAVTAAQAYFSQAIGDARRVLVVDVGWSGTTVWALRHFVNDCMPEKGIEVLGALMATSRAEWLSDSVSAGVIESFLYSPLANMDLTRFMMPAGRKAVRDTDRIHHPLEYLYTQPVATTVSYSFDESGEPFAVRGNNMPENVDQILEMQQGVLDFADAYLDYSRAFRSIRPISPYVALSPLKKAIENPQYCYEVYKDYLYDATPVLFGERSQREHFGDLFDVVHVDEVDEASTGRRAILFVSPEMTYTGTPRSMLRMCNVAASLGYEVVVWSAKSGPFAQEFERCGFSVEIVESGQVDRAKIDGLKALDVDLVVCNTVVCDGYVRAMEGQIPLVWYVREAANLSDFFRTAPSRLDTLRRSDSICCVSEYAADALREWTGRNVEVVHNSVEDVSALAAPYEPRSGGKHRFAQLGTVELRKGYDILLAAYRAMPGSYQERSEVHLAGGFINSGSSFASAVLSEVSHTDGVFFHGTISDQDEKVRLLSTVDTVVVASRDESCSLVALEGAMLSKPLIVTENVGAKYMVRDGTGLVVPTADVGSLRDAMMRMIDISESTLCEMGSASRLAYTRQASMETYKNDLQQLFQARISAGPGAGFAKKAPIFPDRAGTGSAHGVRQEAGDPRSVEAQGRAPQAADRELIVSLTSFPERIGTVSLCVSSLLDQERTPDQVILWLSTDQFPRRELDLPHDLLALVGGCFRVEWVDGDIKPHKKYYYAARQYSDALIVTVDDDAVYDGRLLRSLYDGYLEQPHAVISDRANLILFRPDGGYRAYDAWVYECEYLRGRLTYQLLPTGVGGTLYPPGSIPQEAYDIDAFCSTALYADDIWLKIMTTANGYPVWMPRGRSGYSLIESAQAVALWRQNVFGHRNDDSLENVLRHVEDRYGLRDAVTTRIRGLDRDGTFRSPDDPDLERLMLGRSRLATPSSVGF